jgi:hypothetical protein
MCSHQVPNMFPSSQCFSKHVLLSFFHLYRWAKGEELYTSKYSPSLFSNLPQKTPTLMAQVSLISLGASKLPRSPK